MTRRGEDTMWAADKPCCRCIEQELTFEDMLQLKPGQRVTIFVPDITDNCGPEFRKAMHTGPCTITGKYIKKLRDGEAEGVTFRDVNGKEWRWFGDKPSVIIDVFLLPDYQEWTTVVEDGVVRANQLIGLLAEAGLRLEESRIEAEATIAELRTELERWKNKYKDKIYHNE